MKLIALLSLAALTCSASLPPLPTLVQHRTKLMSPRAASLVAPPKLVAAPSWKPQTVIVGLRCVSLEYQHKEDTHVAYDIAVTKWSGLIVGHTYRLEWTRDLKTWTQLPKSSQTWFTYGVDTAQLDPFPIQIPVASPLDLLPKAGGWFRMRDMTGQ